MSVKKTAVILKESIKRIIIIAPIILDKFTGKKILKNFFSNLMREKKYKKVDLGKNLPFDLMVEEFDTQKKKKITIPKWIGTIYSISGEIKFIKRVKNFFSDPDDQNADKIIIDIISVRICLRPLFDPTSN